MSCIQIELHKNILTIVQEERKHNFNAYFRSTFIYPNEGKLQSKIILRQIEQVIY